MLITKQFRIVLNANIGNINNKKADSLTNAFQDHFEVKMLQEQPGANVFILANPMKREALILEPNKIVYQLESEDDITPNFEEIKIYTDLVLNTLLLEEKTNGFIHIIGQIKSQIDDAMKDSIDKFSPNEEIVKSFNGLKGIGYRFLFEHPSGLWEFKVEPQINETNNFFIEMICNVDHPLSLNEIITISQEGYSDFKENKAMILNKLSIL